MAGSVNKVILIGNVGKKPEIRATQNGSKLATFSIATGKRWKDKETQEYKDKTEWHNIVVFGDGLVNVVENYVNKGSKLYLEGELQTDEYEKDGIKRYSTKIRVGGYNSTLTMLDNKSATSENNQISQESDEKSNLVNTESTKDSSSDLDDDIPF
tara:strand:- start:1480 stop:1944 length:465 start_codon:yes stop_codon:yes gene_type:complete